MKIARFFAPALGGLCALALLAVTTPASAAVQISVSTATARSDFNAFFLGLATKTVETFETQSERQISGDLSTAVGVFRTAGGTGTGSSVIGDGTNLAVRDNPNFGRYNTTPGGSKYLDSNDTNGVTWDVTTGGLFDRIGFLLTDANDQGARLRVTADGATYSGSILQTAQANSTLNFIFVSFSAPVSSAEIRLLNIYANTRQNDGFGVDDATAGLQTALAPSVIPLPATGLLLLGGLAGAAALRRRKA